MRLRRFAVPIILVSAIVLIVGVTAGLISARDQAPSRRAAESDSLGPRPCGDAGAGDCPPGYDGA